MAAQVRPPDPSGIVARGDQHRATLECEAQRQRWHCKSLCMLKLTGYFSLENSHKTGDTKS